jgi:hypothetical protein
MPSTEEYINQFAGSGDTSEDDFEWAKLARHKDPRNLNLRNAEHALFTQAMRDSWGPVGALSGLVAIPGYSAAKWAAQNFPKQSGVPAGIEAATGMKLSQSTRPDLSELYWGLRPLWSQIKRPAGKVSGLSEFAPQ